MAKSRPEVQVETYVEKIGALSANDLNPRKINKNPYEKLKKSFRDFPEMKQLREIVVDENLTILAGHQRIYALKDLGYTDVTVKKVTGFTEAQKREFMIRDNTNAGEWDSDIMANLWDMAELEAFGVPSFTFGDIKDEADDPAAKDSKSGEPIECPNCGHLIEL